jgi:uncharacterized lipoprotein YajG
MSLKKGFFMRKILIILPLIAMIAACSKNDSLENKGREAGAAADKALERADTKVDDAQERIDKGAAKVGEKAQEVGKDINDDLRKLDNAVDAADAELKK